MFRPLLILSSCSISFVSSSLADPPATPETVAPQPFFQEKVVPFVRTYCLECHSGDNPRASFSFQGLKPEFNLPEVAGHWAEVMDAMNLGEMPPEDEPQPPAEQVFAIASWIGNEIRRAEQESRMTGGQILLRRLNRDEYVNTVIDLLDLDPGRADTIRGMLPSDGTADGFDRIAAALFIDQIQMERYLEAAEFISNLAILDQPPEPKKVVWEPHKRLNFGGDIAVLADLSKDLKVKTGVRSGEHRENGAVFWNSGVTSKPAEENDPKKFYGLAAGPLANLTDMVKTDGYYRVRFPAGSDQGYRGLPIRIKLTYGHNSPVAAEHIIENVGGTIDAPEPHEAMLFLRAPAGDQVVQLGLTWNAPLIIMNDPKYTELRVKVSQTSGAVNRARSSGADEATVATLDAERAEAYRQLGSYEGLMNIFIPGRTVEQAPKLFLGTVEIEGPIMEWPPKSHLALAISEDDPESDDTIRKMFSRIIHRAFRRPVDAAEINHFTNQVIAAKSEFGLSHIETLRFGLQSLLVSPGFLLIQEPQPEQVARPLDNFELANRLSYFLWNSMPDAELFRLASAGQLTDPTVRRQQVDRMLKDPKVGRFINSFAGQWLDVRQYGSVQPSNEYRYAGRYDAELEAASKEEPLAFFRHILANNLPITNFIHSDFLVINARLAKHYGIPGVDSSEFQKVNIPADVQRGGVLGMAGLLTLLSDGNRTLPVKRATWVREKLLHDPPPPPPPGAGEIQPNTSGQSLTVRQRLELHRTEPTCASCHAGLDGYGLALENYDAVGAWRTHQNGEGIRPNASNVIDPGGQLKSGRTFSNLTEYKQALLAERDRFGHAFVNTLLTYALTRPIGVIDRETVEDIYKQLERDEFRIQTVVHAVTQSRLFLSK